MKPEKQLGKLCPQLLLCPESFQIGGAPFQPSSSSLSYPHHRENSNCKHRTKATAFGINVKIAVPSKTYHPTCLDCRGEALRVCNHACGDIEHISGSISNREHGVKASRNPQGQLATKSSTKTSAGLCKDTYFRKRSLFSICCCACMIAVSLSTFGMEIHEIVHQTPRGHQIIARPRVFTQCLRYS